MSSLKPIVKWSGGKKDEIKKFIEHIPENFNTYLEPFIGGGADSKIHKNHKLIFI